MPDAIRLPAVDRRARWTRWTPGPVLLILAAFVAAACDDTTGLDADDLRLEGTVEATFDEGAVSGAEVTLDVIGPGGARAWGVAEGVALGPYWIQVYERRE